MEEISRDDFARVELRAGTIVGTEAFPKAQKPAFLLHIDFGSEIGVLKSSAQITDYYMLDGLMGRQVVAVVNFPIKQIGPHRSACLVTGFYDASGGVTLCVPDRPVANGARLA